MTNLKDCLENLINILELDGDSDLHRDAITLQEYLNKNNFQIAVFAPFNHGKSTLLNALLGQKSLPIDLIPSTGAAITIKYATETQIKITLKDGTEKVATNSKILQEYAILDSDRRMRGDIETVEVSCNYPLLKNNVELLDLPGTNDREAQDELVKNKLLTADLIIQVLDARKLMTLLEREKLRDWLQDRGIHTVIFVVNFINLLEEADRNKVYNRLKFVAESFRSQLPSGISNLYRVDALPALRARLKGDYNTVMETGLIDLETALQGIIKANAQDPKTKLTRIKHISQQLIELAREKRQNIEQEIILAEQKEHKKVAIADKAAKLITQGLQRSISEFESWLYLPNLLKAERANLAIALQQQEFKNWKRQFNNTISNCQQDIIEWFAKAKEFFPIDKSIELAIEFPEPPQLEKQGTSTENTTNNNNYEPLITEEIERIFSQTVKTILSGNSKELFANLTNKTAPQAKSNSSEKTLSQLYAELAEAYLTSFSSKAFASISNYQTKVEKTIEERPKANITIDSSKKSQLNSIDSAIASLQQELDNFD